MDDERGLRGGQVQSKARPQLGSRLDPLVPLEKPGDPISGIDLQLDLAPDVHRNPVEVIADARAVASQLQDVCQVHLPIPRS